MARRCFFSFHFDADNFRANQVRQMGVVEGNRPVTDNDWEAVKRGGDEAIKRWIDGQLEGKSCTVVLVGTQTANRKWVRHEIVRSWTLKKGVLCIRIHNLKDSAGETAAFGDNPLDRIDYGETGKKLSSIAKCYDPSGYSSKDVYKWISDNLEPLVDEAISLRNQY